MRPRWAVLLVLLPSGAAAAADPLAGQSFEEIGATLGAVIVVLALRPKWIFAGIREDEDSGVTSRGGMADSAIARMIDPVEVYRLLRAALPMSSARWQRTVPLVRLAAIGGIAALALLFPALPLPGFWTLPANLTLIYLLVMLSFFVTAGR